MASRKRTQTPSAPRVTTSRRDGSWTSLLAATTLGIQAATILASVRLASPLPSVDQDDASTYRLVVQSYAEAGGRSRPTGAAERFVTAKELREGVKIPVVELRNEEHMGERPVLVAWIDSEASDVDYEGLAAKPGPGSVMGKAHRDAGDTSVQITLNRKYAV